jgi:hypothetical protein
MKKLLVVVTALGFVALLAGTGLALEIRVAPQTLVLSSGGGNVTVHTDVAFDDDLSVELYVDGEVVDEEQVGTFADDCGNLVAQCSKETVKTIIGDVTEKFSTVVITLIVEGDEASEDIRVKQ